MELAQPFADGPLGHFDSETAGDLRAQIDAAPADDGGGAGKERGLRSAQLWVGLARAALVAEAAADDAAPPPATEPTG